MTKKYHIKKGFPKSLAMPTGKFLLDYSQHAKDEARNDFYAETPLQLPCMIDFQAVDIFEVEAENNFWTKLSCRMPHDEQTDLTLVIMAENEGKGKKVKTLWLNLKEDQHRSINLNNYNRP